MAIRSITEKVNLITGESLRYTARRKKEIRTGLYKKQQNIISSFSEENIPGTPQEYRQHYICYEKSSFAFADIEMIFDEKSHAVDWIFRYGNEALAKLEMLQTYIYEKKPITTKMVTGAAVQNGFRL